MAKYKVKEKDFETPPENVYAMDLVGIDSMEGRKGPFLRWRFVIADISEQDKYAGVFVTAITPMMPTMNNRFGKFLQVLYPATQIGAEGDTEKIIDSKFRVKGFVEHNKTIDKGEEIIYCNCSKFLEGSAQAGVGCGRQDLDADGKMKRPQEQQQAQPAGKQPPAAAPTVDAIPW
jgi:hypothetical protein